MILYISQDHPLCQTKTKMHPANPPIDYSRKWFIMAAVATGIFLATIDGSIVNVALPVMQTKLATTFSLVQWVVLGYLLTVTTLMLSIGRWADMVGKKRIYSAGFIIFTLGSFLCGISPTIYLLIGARIFQASGAAMMMALGTAIVTENFPPSERGRALGISGLMVSLGIIAGPTVGGIILGSLSWHWIFYVNLPIGIIGIIMVSKFVPNRIPGIRQKFDFFGAVWLFASVSCLLLGLTAGEENGFNSPIVYSLLLAFIIFLAAFIVTEKRAEQPMIDLNLFKDGLFSVNLVTGLMTFIGLSGTLILMPFYLQNVLGHSPRVAGLMMSVVPLALGLTSILSGWLSDKFDTRALTATGLFLLVIGFVLVSTLSVDTTIPGYIIRFLPIGLGMGMFQTPNNSAIMSSAPKDKLGVASGLLSLTRTLGQVIGISVLGAFWTGRVLFYAGTNLSGGASSASPAAQTSGLQDTAHLIIIGIAIALVLSLIAWRKGRAAYSSSRIHAADPNPTQNSK